MEKVDNWQKKLTMTCQPSPLKAVGWQACVYTWPSQSLPSTIWAVSSYFKHHYHGEDGNIISPNPVSKYSLTKHSAKMCLLFDNGPNLWSLTIWPNVNISFYTLVRFFWPLKSHILFFGCSLERNYMGVQHQTSIDTITKGCCDICMYDSQFRCLYLHLEFVWTCPIQKLPIPEQDCFD